MPLTVVRRKQTGAITISGTIRLMGGLTMRVQRRAASNDPTLAAEEASVLEAEILRYDWYGQHPAQQKEDSPMSGPSFVDNLEVFEHLLEQITALRADVVALRADVLGGRNRLEKRLNGLDDRLVGYHCELDTHFRVTVPRGRVSQGNEE